VQVAVDPVAVTVYVVVADGSAIGLEILALFNPVGGDHA